MQPLYEKITVVMVVVEEVEVVEGEINIEVAVEDVVEETKDITCIAKMKYYYHLGRHQVQYFTYIRPHEEICFLSWNRK